MGNMLVGMKETKYRRQDYALMLKSVKNKGEENITKEWRILKENRKGKCACKDERVKEKGELCLNVKKKKR